MAVAKNKKKVIKVVDENTEIVEKNTELTEEEKILGKTETKVIVTNVKYENPSIRYKVTNLTVKNSPMFVTGDLVETFIGANNLQARKELISGAKKVTTKDVNGEPLYLIEVVSE